MTYKVGIIINSSVAFEVGPTVATTHLVRMAASPLSVLVDVCLGDAWLLHLDVVHP